MIAIANAMLVFNDHLLEDAALLVNNGKIVDYGYTDSLALPELPDY